MSITQSELEETLNFLLQKGCLAHVYLSYTILVHSEQSTGVVSPNDERFY